MSALPLHHWGGSLSLQAAELKHLVPVANVVAKTILNEADPYEKLILGALAGSTAMDEILDKHKEEWVLKPSVATAFSQACRTLNLSLSQLGLLTHDLHWALWNFTIKNHTLEHISQDATEFNPRLGWNYASESLLMHVRTMIMANRTQASMMGLQQVVMKKWIAGFEFSLLPRRCLWDWKEGSCHGCKRRDKNGIKEREGQKIKSALCPEKHSFFRTIGGWCSSKGKGLQIWGHMHFDKHCRYWKHTCIGSETKQVYQNHPDYDYHHS